MSDEQLDECARRIEQGLTGAEVIDGKIAVFTVGELPAQAVDVIADYDLSIDKPGLITYKHAEKTKMGSDEPMEATFILKPK